MVGRGGDGVWLGYVIFFLFSKETKSEKKFCFLFEVVKVREDWLVQVNLFYKESKSKKKKKKQKKNISSFLWGGGV